MPPVGPWFEEVRSESPCIRACARSSIALSHLLLCCPTAARRSSWRRLGVPAGRDRGIGAGRAFPDAFIPIFSRNGLIEDPFFGTNEKDLQWIENEDWEYRTSFFDAAGTSLATRAHRARVRGARHVRRRVSERFAAPRGRQHVPRVAGPAARGSCARGETSCASISIRRCAPCGARGMRSATSSPAARACSRERRRTTTGGTGRRGS